MQKKYFSKYKEPLTELPYLAKVQLDSYAWLLKKGLKEVFDEFSPIEDVTGKEFALDFVNFSLDDVSRDEYHAKAHNLSYEAPLRVTARLTNKNTGEIKTQDIFFADFPLMTKRGTFIINGIERVIVSQLVRSFGVYFTLHYHRGKKLFGAKIIPGRGVWLEFETDAEGVIWVKIDRKRKISATTLLRIFGLEKESAIKERFRDIDNGEISFMEKTLSKDLAKTADDAYVEVYKRIRPGDLATPDNARHLIENTFSSARYDISPVGRYKTNIRFAHFKVPKPDVRVLTLDDIVCTISEIIRKNNTPDELPDDIDHLGHRRIRGMGEMLQNRLRVGLARMERHIRDRMSVLDAETLTPLQVINSRPFMTVLRDFFMTNQLSQFMDQVNVLAELEHKRRLSALGPGGLTRERAGFEVRDVHPSHYGRICPIQTPEGPNIGLVGHLSIYASINEFGLLETPYRKVVDGVITDEIRLMTAFEEMQHIIAHGSVQYDDSRILDKEVEARIKGSFGFVPREAIEYIDVSSQQAFSIATCLIPFLGHDDANRALMGSNMQRQAVPCIKADPPLVGTGMESRAARDSGQIIIAEQDGKVVHADAQNIVVRSGGRSREYPLINFMRSNQVTVLHHTPRVAKGMKVRAGDLLADNSSTKDGDLALGQNLLVAFLSWRGANFEDAIIVSERLVKDDRFTSIHIEEFTVNVRDTKLGEEITTPDIPNVGEEKLKDLDEDGIVRIGAEVREGDILVGKISPKGEIDLTPEERLLHAIFGEKARDVKDTSLKLPNGKHGRVVGVKVFSREEGDRLESGVIKQVQVEVAQLRRISVGDKLAGRHGNKGVISKILPEEDMPYLEDGTPVDMILNPLGVASRMNLGQILETHLGLAAHTLKYRAVCPALTSPSEQEIRDELEHAGFSKDGKVRLYDGRTGEVFSQKVTVGYIYMMKLNHMVEDKIHMRSIGSYSLITQQPLGGKAQGGGQRFGEMEVWALEGYGAASTLQEMITIKSDDVSGRASIYDSIVRGERRKSPHIPTSFHVLVNELKGLALDVVINYSEQSREEEEETGEKETTKASGKVLEKQRAA
ncbi:MAG: DNA-directed RNA polymerase subunit beta [Candidatus Ryanbacteria bacterium RIFCSPHIGHO2_02_FULL_45_43]|uniref:DNA-directed RNA polymerase subunit beta n=1 Tax=Candidatus Ryanbacteria bacterium RIFCSPHIGHO2_01_45_13 TaxID=1802112 RepID=A0A1G2FTF6_9BACT|nr:MAG: DNA-directed RNA polymerase subunit beta [Candidatus Ryanbacteria bacterium RIFCSPHIGHO2_01_45_13]OGZ41525.1 MAG: DNA-directed RNA polymerase subunit beta [Candidatus Ryanbacteria bacterium RIFCSPHIGHO2_01_FULL_44_130]OGZ47992.1 MAG: DNA-directed RNA polymerase subunit beta [Candidatus Ryanbacteria bacterium RIFCSPHIGHO2_02_FULL_45_43]OGZ50128.1 MAG: DNA-directed RNA polymerase subunit beta [Candidatus Ryanbacteria bacterium RIFCSPHIGHO2_12_FULL_44_20]OGZ51130.1 MAG: DNA-directed RNA po